MRKFYSIGLGLLLITHLLSSQQLTQTLRGKVIDKDTRTPLIGVNLIIVGTDPLVGTITDMNGEFKFKLLAGMTCKYNILDMSQRSYQIF